MSVVLHNAVISALREAYTEFFAGNEAGYQEHMKTAQAEINAIRSLGEPLDGSTGRPIELLVLQGEYNLLLTLTELCHPATLIELYRTVEVSFVLGSSAVIERDDPFLPAPASLCAFYGVYGARGEALADEVEHAAKLYGSLTGGGGGGVATMYRAELAEKKGDRKLASKLAQKSMREITGDKWMIPIGERLIQKEDDI